ncbi:MAG: septum formation initiator family protein [Butyrivibrio sp.]|nr:septum formation initiator family protein [Butyrivibrio sp.]
MATKARYRRGRSQNSQSMFLVGIAVLILLVVVSVKGYSLLQKEKVYQAKEEALQAQIDEETQRAEEIVEFEKYTHTRKYIEEVAKDKLGLVYPGEIIFKNESE